MPTDLEEAYFTILRARKKEQEASFPVLITLLSKDLESNRDADLDELVKALVLVLLLFQGKFSGV